MPTGERALWCDVLLAKEAVLDRMGRREEQRAALDELGAEAALDPGPAGAGPPRRGRAGCSSAASTPPCPPVAEEAAELARRAGRADLESDALMQGGRSLAYLNEHETAQELLDRRCARPSAIGDHRRAGEVLRLLGVVATNRGENEEALRMLDAARAEHRQVNDREGEAMVTGQVGALLMKLGRLEEARAASRGGAGGVPGHRAPLPRGRHAHQPRPDRDGAGPAGRRPRRRAGRRCA